MKASKAFGDFSRRLRTKAWSALKQAKCWCKGGRAPVRRRKLDSLSFPIEESEGPAMRQHSEVKTVNEVCPMQVLIKHLEQEAQRCGMDFKSWHLSNAVEDDNEDPFAAKMRMSAALRNSLRGYSLDL